MQPIDVITALAAASSKARKEQVIIAAYQANCTEFFTVARLAADPFIQFGLTKVVEIVEDDGDPGSLTFAEFHTLCDQLCARTLSEDMARMAIRHAAERCHVPTWNTVYRRVLLKALHVVDSAMINRVLKRLGIKADQLRIPSFACQTATHGVAKQITGQFLVDVKFSGDRLLAVLDKAVCLYNSKGEAERCPKCVEIAQAMKTLADLLPTPIVLDGVLTEAGEYVLFDLISLDDFRDRCSMKTQHQRRVMLELLQTSGAFSGSRIIRVAPQIQIDFGTDVGLQMFREFSQQAVEQGYRAVVCKKPDAPYLGKQNRAWMLMDISPILE